jgi:GAF domain-containing protein
MTSLKKVIFYETDNAKTMIQDTIDMMNNTDYQETLLSERLFVINDIGVTNELTSAIGELEPSLCAYMDAPIRVRGKLFGVVSIEQHRCEEFPQKREWTAEEQGFASSLADLMAIAIESAERIQTAKELEYALQSAKDANKANSDLIKRMERRGRLLQAVNTASALLLTADENGDFEPVLKKSMEIIGRSVDADRVHIWRNENVDGGLQFTHAYIWKNKNDDNVFTASVAAYAKMHEWEAKFKRSEHVGGPISSLSPEEQEYFAAFGIKSVLLIPLILNEQFWGLVSIDDCVRERNFSEEEIDILRSVSFMMVSSINRHSLVNKIHEANERLILMIDTSPLCTQIWDRNLNTIDCNEAGVRLYGFKDKQEYKNRFLQDCSPEYQPDGQRSDEKATALVHKAFEEGRCFFDWTHKMPDADIPIPAEITLVRAKYKDEDVVLGYTHDMREYETMMKGIEHRDTMLQAVNKATNFLFNSDIESFDANIVQAMGMIAEAVDADRVYIWENSMVDGQLCGTQTHIWHEGSSPPHDYEVPVNFPYNALMPGWEEVLRSGKSLNALVRDLPPAAQKLFSSMDIVSILSFPIIVGGDFWGLMGFIDQ